MALEQSSLDVEVGLPGEVLHNVVRAASGQHGALALVDAGLVELDKLGEGGLVHAVDGGKLGDEKVEQRGAARDGAVLLARLGDASPRLGGHTQPLPHLCRGLLAATTTACQGGKSTDHNTCSGAGPLTTMHNTQLQPHTTRLLGDGEDLHQTLILQQIARGGRQAEEKVVLQLADAAAVTLDLRARVGCVCVWMGGWVGWGRERELSESMLVRARVREFERWWASLAPLPAPAETCTHTRARARRLPNPQHPHPHAHPPACTRPPATHLLQQRQALLLQLCFFLEHKPPQQLVLQPHPRDRKVHHRHARGELGREARRGEASGGVEAEGGVDVHLAVPQRDQQRAAWGGARGRGEAGRGAQRLLSCAGSQLQALCSSNSSGSSPPAHPPPPAPRPPAH